MLMQTFRVTKKEYYGMLWYFLEWSIVDDDVSDVPFLVALCLLTQ